MPSTLVEAISAALVGLNVTIDVSQVQAQPNYTWYEVIVFAYDATKTASISLREAAVDAILKASLDSAEGTLFDADLVYAYRPSFEPPLWLSRAGMSIILANPQATAPSNARH